MNVNDFKALNLQSTNVVSEKVFTMSNSSEEPQGFNYFKVKEGTFLFQYKTKDTIPCVETIVFSLKIRLPFVFNKNKLDKQEEGSVLSKINPNEVLSVKRVRKFLGAGRIEIETEINYKTLIICFFVRDNLYFFIGLPLFRSKS